MTRAILVLAAVASGCGGPPPTPPTKVFDLNDVSFLYPLPDWSHRDQLLKLESGGTDGVLLPRSFYDQLPPLVTGESLADSHDRFRIVSMRVDPCFPATADDHPACVHQIRLVAQPISGHDQLASLGSNELSTDDASLHLFYTLDDTQWAALVNDLKDLKTLAGGDSEGVLAIHPVMLKEGLDGAYATKLQQVLFTYASPKTLSRVAIMQLTAFFDTDTRVGAAWGFTIYDRSGSSLVAQDVARLKALTAQGVTETGGSDDSRRGGLTPSPLDDDFDTLLVQQDTLEADDGTLHSAFQSALKFENPSMSTPRTVDCGSCHLASRARTAAEADRDVNTSTFAESYTNSRYDLHRVDDTPTEAHTLRAFGYFFRKTALSQRVINDSAVTADALSSTLSE